MVVAHQDRVRLPKVTPMLSRVHAMPIDTDSLFIIEELKSLPGAKSCDGECSAQVYFRLDDGSILVIGTTDSDVAEVAGLWVRLDQTFSSREICKSCCHERRRHRYPIGVNAWSGAGTQACVAGPGKCDCTHFAYRYHQEDTTTGD